MSIGPPRRQAWRTLALVLVLGTPMAASACSDRPSGGTTSTSTTTSTTAAVPTTSGTPTTQGSPTVSCALVTPAEVSAALGITGTVSQTTVNGPVTLCSLPGGGLVRFETGYSLSDFQSAKAQFPSHGETTSDLAGLGDAAYTSTAAASNTVVALRGSTEILVTASFSLAQLESLVRAILPSL